VKEQGDRSFDAKAVQSPVQRKRSPCFYAHLVKKLVRDGYVSVHFGCIPLMPVKGNAILLTGFFQGNGLHDNGIGNFGISKGIPDPHILMNTVRCRKMIRGLPGNERVS
jgi:hypothetical protein